MTSASMSVMSRSTRGSADQVPVSRRVAVALEPDAGDRPDAVDGDHRRVAGRRDVDRLDTPDEGRCVSG